MKRLAIFLLFFLIMAPITAVQAQPLNHLTLMTEQYPPFNFEEGGTPQGITVDMLVLMLKEAGSTLTRKDIKVMPWARGYTTVQKKKNSILFGMTFTEKRKNIFKWIGPIVPSKTVLVAKKSRHIKINSVKDISNFKTGVIRDDVAEQMLLEKGVPKSALVSTAKAINNVKMLNAGRTDMWAYDGITALWFIKKSGLNPSDFGPVFTVNTGYMYYGVNKKTPDSVVKKLQDALDKLKKNGQYQKVIDKYSK